MQNAVANELAVPNVVDRTIFQAELDALPIQENAHTREGDAIAAARRRLPMVADDFGSNRGYSAAGSHS